MEQEYITFEKLSWGAFMARIFGETGPDAYMSIYRDIEFRKSLVYTPSSVTNEEVRDKLIGGFLNKWRSRFPNTDESADAVLTTLEGVSPLLQATLRFNIEIVDLDKSLTVGGRQLPVYQAIAEIFSAIANCYGFRTTPGAKIMGVLNPGLFAMWDDAIAVCYLAGDTTDIFSGIGYATFLRKMQHVARQCISDFQTRFGREDPASYLSEKLRLDPPVPLAKFLDEYNWITITKRVQLPPRWHPCDDRSTAA